MQEKMREVQESLKKIEVTGVSGGDLVKVTLFGESHGNAVGALLEGIPAGTEIKVLIPGTNRPQKTRADP